jgi:SPP1 family predicted phage head-tail adaptor
MRAGWLRHRVTIQEKVVTRDAYGEEDFTWADVLTVWGSIEPARGREFLQATAEQVTYDTIIRLRYRDDITPENRILWNGQAYDVRSVVSILEKGRELEVQCIRVHT